MQGIPLTENINPASKDLDTKSIADIIEIMNTEDKKAVDAVHQAGEQINKAIAAALETFNKGGRLFYVGTGTSGRLGILDASECPPTFSVSPEMVQGIIAGGDVALKKAVEGAEDDEEAGRLAVHEHDVRHGDMVIGISASGCASFVAGALEEAMMIGARPWLLTCNQKISPFIEQIVEGVIIVDTGPEVIAGSTRLKAGTATKLVLNMLSTISMIKTGKVYGNLMVDVNPTNRKLKERAKRIVSQITGCSADEAAELLEKSGNMPKVAIVMKMKGLGKEAAERVLADNKGFLRESLK